MHNTNSRSFWGRWLPVVLMVSVIFWLSSQNDTMIRVLIFGQDLAKPGHVFLYFVLTLLVIRALTKVMVRSDDYRWAVIVVLALSIGDEVYQRSVTTRDGNFVDVLIDTIGILVAIFVYGVVGDLRHPYRGVSWGLGSSLDDPHGRDGEL